MGKTSSAVKEKYNAKAYDDIRLRVKAGQKDKIASFAKDIRGMSSLNAYINSLIEEDMERENK
jgi:cystathionine beta-lyase family protein involved in aluminum resistance